MNRRDLLKQAGSLLLLGPSLGARVFAQRRLPEECPPSEETQDLIVSVLGPFCFWRDPKYIKIMAPQIGPNCKRFPHIPYILSTCNEIEIPSQGSPTYELEGLDSPVPRPAVQSGALLPQFAQEKCSSHIGGELCKNCLPEQRKKTKPLQSTGKSSRSEEEYRCCNPLFTVLLPPPDRIVGIYPLCATLTPNTAPMYYATSAMFFYKNTKENPVQLGKIQLASASGSTGSFSFKPQFGYDKDLPAATLNITLAPQNRADEENHRQFVFGKMKSMFPWIKANLVPCTSAQSAGPHRHLLLFGGGTNCIVPVMMLG